MYDYEAQDDDEVSFQDGDLIINVSSIDGGWMTGEVQRTGQVGNPNLFMVQPEEKSPSEHGSFPRLLHPQPAIYRHFYESNDFTEPDMAEPWKLCIPTPRHTKTMINSPRGI
ncbi:hypothetical protein NQ317_017927 [Molorchus minor]|uniref:SH3 domain-containing protein n=1 Tax=Molorchus minor TaxID=1323400 RepID=A0ABQ9J5L1_9CUCU|nr:hypothetical protein NQ317_017927 [Molorchus minor]